MINDPAERAILDQLAARGAGKTICPTEAARALAGHPADDKWRASLSPVRLAAVRLARAGRILILHKGKPVDLDHIRGVIRLKLAPDDAA